MKSRKPDARFFEVQVQPRRTAVDVVTDAVRKAIETGVLIPGEKINEEMLASKLNVSRMPVRQALRALEAEGLITLIPHAGGVVSALTPEELEELYHLRATLEGMALARAVPRYTEANLRQLRACLEGIDPDNVSVEEYVKMNRQFHQLLYAPSGWNRLIHMINQIGRNVTRYMIISVSDPDVFAQSAREHWEILKACEAADAAAAERLIKQHVLRVGEAVVKKVRADQKAPEQQPAQ